MIKPILTLCSIVLATSMLAENSIGYVTLKEVKAFDTAIDVIFSDDQEHLCVSAEHKTRFIADPKKTHQVSFLLAAFIGDSPVQLAYVCQADGHPLITGVRLR